MLHKWPPQCDVNVCYTMKHLKEPVAGFVKCDVCFGTTDEFLFRYD